MVKHWISNIMAGRALLLFFLTVPFSYSSANYHDPQCADGRQAIVHLFEWKWTDIAEECERFIGPQGYCGVQVSPANEHRIIWQPGYNKQIRRPWYERYQPVSYKLVSRSGNEAQFMDMVQRCNKVRVRIYVDVVINHMAAADAGQSRGTAGSTYNARTNKFDGVPYSAQDFNSKQKCGTHNGNINNYKNSNEVRNCNLLGLQDLDLSKDYVRGKIADYLNHLIAIGVGGFRVDAAKHMWPGDLGAILSKLRNLDINTFGENVRPFVYLEVIDLGGEPIKAAEYKHLARITEFKYGQNLGNVIRKRNQLKNLRNFGQNWGMLNTNDAFVFIDNHDNQRGHGAGGFNVILTYFEAKMYKMATAFMLAWPYGQPRVMSSYQWQRIIQGGKDKNDWVGPPHNEDYSTKSVTINKDYSCGNGWVCEHRWSQIANMAKFAKTVAGTGMNDWWDNGNNQVAFSRGDRGFIAINNEGSRMDAAIQTGLEPGQYCNIISAHIDSKCTETIIVDANRRVKVIINGNSQNPMVAIHVDWKIGKGQTNTVVTPSRSPMKPPINVVSGDQNWKRTVILIRKSTSPGDTMFLRGGLNDDYIKGCSLTALPNRCSIPIRYTEDTTRLYQDAMLQAWKISDSVLDWIGAQSGQGRYQGKQADGTPLIWTTSDRSSGRYSKFNRYGDHYWMLDVQMDCSNTMNGWFELKARLNGQWESRISQDQTCRGTAGGKSLYRSQNHQAFCGKVNVFEFSGSGCFIDNMY